MLKGLGYYTGDLDTSFGNGCLGAVKAFQKATGMAGDGEVGAMSSPSDAYISRKEFEDFKKEMLTYAKQSIQSTTGTKQKSASNSSGADKG